MGYNGQYRGLYSLSTDVAVDDQGTRESRFPEGGHPVRGPREPDPFLAGKHAVEELRDVTARIRSNPGYAAPDGALETIRSLLRSDRMRVLRTGKTG